MSRKRYVQIHRWLGLISGLVVFIIGITGAIYAFEKELSAFFYKDIYKVTPEEQKISIDSVLIIASKTLGPQYPVSIIRMEQDPAKAIEVNSWKFNREANTYWNKVIYSRAVFINPYTGKVTREVNLKWEFFNVVLAIHTSLLLGNIGGLIIGWSTVIFIILLITGLILWYPKNKAAAKQRFWFKWKKTTSFKRKNYDWHNISGFYSFLLLLIMALTGIIWSFDWWEETVLKTVNMGEKVEREKPVYSDTTHITGAIPLSVITEQIPGLSFNRKKYFIVLPDQKGGTVNAVVPGEGRDRYKFIQLYFDRFSGKFIHRAKLFHQKTPGEKLRNMNIDIHTGSILGFPGKLLACILSLIAAALPVTGFLIWRSRQKSRTKTSMA